ncbi:BatD family protein [Rubrimonas cliftonensis]|uniref:Oxygen tolerance n=1 Tax=Rubrimonas cliftonensis TaxID=89524 RepID=A0A1H4E3S3_9RHOB|nr:BatD family protein [Rubrimonas cliftonensis]SEA79556.1 Oxygen tolerance [Rubrimonas cliftonensis]
MTRRAALLLLAVCVAGRGAADAPADWSLAIVPAPLGPEIYVGEMIPVTLRGVYGGGVALENLEAPETPGLSWVQLGRDRWFDEMVDGLARRVFERRYAMWAEKSGTLEIPSFGHQLTLIPRRGEREEVTMIAPPATLRIAPPPVAGEAGPDRWLPLTALHVDETWSGPTDALDIGEVAVRTVTLLAHGLTPDRMPTTPDIDTDAVFVFPEDEIRTVEITPDGPVTTVVWRWTITPDTPEPSLIPPLRIPWFDTRAREMREIALPARRFAVDGAVFGVERRDERLERAARWAGPLGFAGGLALGAGAIAAAARRRGLSAREALAAVAVRARRALAPVAARIELWRARAGLRAAVARGDAFAARRAARRRAQAGDLDPATLAMFDRLAYGPEPTSRDALRRAAERQPRGA